MNRLRPEAHRLFELARHEDDPDPEVQGRVERKLAARIALGAGVATTSVSVAKAAAASLATSLVKSVVVVTVAGTLVGTSWLATRSSDSVPRTLPAAAVARSPSAPVAAQAVSPASEEPHAERATPESTFAPTSGGAASSAATPERERGRAEATRRSVPRPRQEPASPSVDPLVAEAEALREAQRALRGGEARRALELLDEQEQTHGAGSLHEERGAARILALCQAGEGEQARIEAERFERRWPRSALLGRVRSACRGR